jgi:hypothetical protein
LPRESLAAFSSLKPLRPPAAFEDQMGRCLQQFANTRDAAQVMLECTADAGKLTECKVVDNSAAGKGFDKAAMCIAEKLPMGAKTGTVKVPFRFPGGA